MRAHGGECRFFSRDWACGRVVFSVISTMNGRFEHGSPWWEGLYGRRNSYFRLYKAGGSYWLTRNCILARRLSNNAVFERMGYDYAFVPFNVKPENLESAVRGMEALGFLGYNVTAPYKKCHRPLSS